MSAAELVFNALTAHHASGSTKVSRDDKIDAGRFIAGNERTVTVIPVGGARPLTEDNRVGYENIRELFDIAVRMGYRTGDLQTTLLAMTNFVREEIAWIIANRPRGIGKLDWTSWNVEYSYAKADKDRVTPHPVMVIHFWAESIEIASDYEEFSTGPDISPWPPTRVIFSGDISVGDYAPAGDEINETYEVPSTD